VEWPVLREAPDCDCGHDRPSVPGWADGLLRRESCCAHCLGQPRPACVSACETARSAFDHSRRGAIRVAVALRAPPLETACGCGSWSARQHPGAAALVCLRRVLRGFPAAGRGFSAARRQRVG
jgi:hypothetical protein